MPPKASKKAKNAIKKGRKPNVRDAFKPPSPQLPSELLTMIFEPLCFLDLLRCRQVCKSWNEHLRGGDSKADEKLFLRTNRWHPEKVTLGLDIHICGIVIRERAAALPYIRYDLVIDEGADMNLRNDLLAYHPIIAAICQHFDIIYQHAFHRIDNFQYLPFISFDDLWAKTGGCQVAGRHDGGSWEDMLVCVPAAKEVQIRIVWVYPQLPDPDENDDDDDGFYRLWVDIRNEEGVRMKDLVQQLRIHLHRVLLRVPKFARRIKIEGGRYL
jgi:hypothetical protein